MQNADCEKILANIRREFLLCLPVKTFDPLGLVDIALQEQIINYTTRSELILKFPVRVTYQKSFLKNLIGHIEKQGSVVHDCVYEEYGRLVALPHRDVYFRHYPLENGRKNIVLKENINLISDGTTGLRTWQAALALSEWILQNPSHFHNKTILELGSGVGLTGLTISLCCKPKVVYLSDCHPAVLTTLCDNIKINIDSDSENTNSDDRCLLETTTKSCVVRVLNLPWEEVTGNFCQQLGQIDIILAADVVYDRDIFQPLINAVEALFLHCQVREFILACTERNSDTLSEFLALISKHAQIGGTDNDGWFCRAAQF